MTHNIIFIFLTLVLNIIFLINLNKISKIINIFDFPNLTRKIHKKPTPLLGGLLIFFNIIFFFIFFFIFDKNILFNVFIITELKPLIYFLFLLILIFFIGLYDDKYNLSAFARVLMIYLLVYFFLKIDNTSIISNLSFSFTDHEIKFGIGSVMFTSICLIVLIIACNMFDGINFQSFLFFFTNFLFLFLIHPNIFLIILVISILVFGYLNFSGKIFLGDSGVYLLSVILGIFYLKFYNFSYGNMSSDVIFSMLLLPVLDSIRCIVIRTINGKNPLFGDKTHLHHILIKKFSYQKTILIISSLILIPFIFYMLDVSVIFTIGTIFLVYFYFLYFGK